MIQPRPIVFDFLTKAACVLFVFQFGAVGALMLQQGDLPNSFLFLMMATGLFVGAQGRLTRNPVNSGARGWLTASRAGALAILAVASLVLVFRDYVRPPMPGIIMQVVVSTIWAVIALKGAAAGKFRPGGPVGLCVPWTMRSRHAWDRAHRALGRVLFWGGLAGLVASFFAPPLVSIAGCLVTIAVAVSFGLFESWRGWRDDPDRIDGARAC